MIADHTNANAYHAHDQAIVTYERLWHKAARYYPGAEGEPAPVFQLMPPGGVGSLHTDRSGPVPVVSAKGWIMRALAGKGKHGDSVLDAGGYKRMAEKSLLHEWAHVYQRPEVYNNIPEAEYDASHWAQSLAKRILARPGKRKKLPLDRSQFS